MYQYLASTILLKANVYIYDGQRRGHHQDNLPVTQQIVWAWPPSDVATEEEQSTICPNCDFICKDILVNWIISFFIKRRCYYLYLEKAYIELQRYEQLQTCLKHGIYLENH